MSAAKAAAAAAERLGASSSVVKRLGQSKTNSSWLVFICFYRDSHYVRFFAVCIGLWGLAGFIRISQGFMFYQGLY